MVERSVCVLVPTIVLSLPLMMAVLILMFSQGG
jgi:hypothetical protein